MFISTNKEFKAGMFEKKKKTNMLFINMVDTGCSTFIGKPTAAYDLVLGCTIQNPVWQIRNEH